MIKKIFIKRIFDFVFSMIGILLLLPVFLIIGVFIKIDSTGPIIYRARRIGLNEKVFFLYKFRTMCSNSDEISITVGNRDERITRPGYFLRNTKLDEIPQLFNVLIGDISFVGPRPDVPIYKKYYKKYFPDYYKIKPGITSYSSIYFRHESELYKNVKNPEFVYINKTIPEKVELDKDYFNNVSLYTDIIIILKTLKKIID